MTWTVPPGTISSVAGFQVVSAASGDVLVGGGAGGHVQLAGVDGHAGKRFLVGPEGRRIPRRPRGAPRRWPRQPTCRLPAAKCPDRPLDHAGASWTQLGTRPSRSRRPSWPELCLVLRSLNAYGPIPCVNEIWKSCSNGGSTPAHTCEIISTCGLVQNPPCTPPVVASGNLVLASNRPWVYENRPHVEMSPPCTPR